MNSVYTYTFLAMSITLISLAASVYTKPQLQNAFTSALETIGLKKPSNPIPVPKNPYVSALFPKSIEPMEKIKTILENLNNCRNENLLFLNKSECLAQLRILDDLFDTSIRGLNIIAKFLFVQLKSMRKGKPINTHFSFTEIRYNSSPSVSTAAAHARLLTSPTYSRRFWMSESQTRYCDMLDSAVYMQKACSEIEGLRKQCRLLMEAVEAEPDTPSVLIDDLDIEEVFIVVPSSPARCASEKLLSNYQPPSCVDEKDDETIVVL